MGLKIPELPDDYGFRCDCDECWGVGKTPSHVYVTSWDVVACDGHPVYPNGRTFLLEQDPVDPCFYQGDIIFEGATWRCYWNVFFLRGEHQLSELQINRSDPPDIAAFFCEADACAVDYENQNECRFFWGAEGGKAHVMILPDPIAYALTHQYHFATIPGVLYEHDDCGMDHAWYKLNHRSDKTNVLIYLDKEAIEYD